ncbi:MAG TPA: DUF2760 domain-containing protein [Gemmataceae bacterium]|nr:DUF2760 domain-containing protein [Gemmataceae bacterium]
MENPVVIVIVTIVVVIVIRLLVALALAGGEVNRLGLAVRASWRILRDRAFGERLRPLFQPVEQKPAKPSGEPLRLLAVLQRDSRFLDFFMDDINAAGDEQILAFVKKMHPECQVSLKDHLVLEPVIARAEGDTVEVPAGFDPSTIRLLGNVTGQPPFRGTLQHRGWRVEDIKLAPPPAGQDEFVVQPAEVYLP